MKTVILLMVKNTNTAINMALYPEKEKFGLQKCLFEGLQLESYFEWWNEMFLI